MNDEDNQVHGTDTPGSGANPPEPLRLPEPRPPDRLWAVWSPEGNSGNGAWLQPWDARLAQICILVFEDQDAARRSAEFASTITELPMYPALLGVSPAVVAQRDKLGEALAEAETAARNEMEWLQTISATASPRYRLVEGRQRRWAALLAEWRAAQEREGKGSTADGQ
jgi:hypothetical protein